MSPEDRKRLRDDMHGRVRFEETEEMRSSGPWALKEALARLPAEEKDAYLEALERSPDVVRVETDPLAFLRAEDYCLEVSCSSALNFSSHTTIRCCLYNFSLIASSLLYSTFPGCSSTSSTLLEMQTRHLWESRLSTHDTSWCNGPRPRNTGEGVGICASTRSAWSRCSILASDTNESDRGISLLYCKLPSHP
jgi:hypothetical protein